MAGPTKAHWRAALGVVRYLAGTNTCHVRGFWTAVILYQRYVQSPVQAWYRRVPCTQIAKSRPSGPHSFQRKQFTDSQSHRVGCTELACICVQIREFREFFGEILAVRSHRCPGPGTIYVPGVCSNSATADKNCPVERTTSRPDTGCGRSVSTVPKAGTYCRLSAYRTYDST